MPFGPASRLGVSLFDETPAIEWAAGRSLEAADIAIQAAYRQVLGNVYVMDSERLTVPESRLKRGELTIKEFVRAIAKSDLYRNRFFNNCSCFRAIEFNFRHLLGRAPADLEEMQTHTALLDAKGYEADIDSYIDSEEYQTAFGEDTVPYIRGYKSEACQNVVQFTNLFQLVRGAASSSLKGDVAGNSSKLNDSLIQGIPNAVISPNEEGAAFSPPSTGSRSRLGVEATAEGKVYRIEVTGYRAKTFNSFPKSRRANKVFLVPFDKLLPECEKIRQQGGVVASISPV